MFGEATFGQVTFSRIIGTSAPLTPFELLIENPVAARMFLVEMAPYDFIGSPDGIENFYFADQGFVTGASDSPAQKNFDPIVVQPLFYTRTMISERIGGIAPSTGELELRNTDAQLDTLPDNYAIDGRDVTVKMGGPDFAYTDFAIIFKGTGVGWVANEDLLRLAVVDKLAELNQPIQTNFYLGTGGLEGGSDLIGKPKPLCYGECHNVPMVQVDAANLVYQVHDGAISSIDAVYDRGVALTVSPGGSPSPDAGEYEVTASTGTVQLGSSPAGLITADVKGDATSTYVNSVADIIKRLLEIRLSWNDQNFDNPAFATLQALNSATVGIWISTAQRTMLSVIDELIGSVGGYAGFTRLNRLTVGVFAAPTGAAKLSLTSETILEITRAPLGGENNPANYRRQVAYKKNYAVQTDIAGSVPDAHRTFVAEAYRVEVATDATIQTKHLLATDPPAVLSLLVASADAATEVARLLALYKEDRYIYTVRCKMKIWTLALNDVVKITFARWNLSGGKFGRIVAIRENAAANESELDIFV